MKNEKLKELYKNYNHLLLLLYYPVIFTIFGLLEINTVPKYFMYSRLDDFIPFVPLFVIPYFLWFAYIPASLAFFGLKNRSVFIRLCLHMFIGMTISYIVYWVYPNGQNLRPATVAGNDIFSGIVRWLYGFDTPTNSNPSMHVLNAIAVHLAIAKHDWKKYNKAFKASSFVLMMLIILSTMTLKQHSIIDAFYGALISIILYIGLYKVKYDNLLNLVKEYLNRKNAEAVSKEQ